MGREGQVQPRQYECECECECVSSETEDVYRGSNSLNYSRSRIDVDNNVSSQKDKEVKKKRILIYQPMMVGGSLHLNLIAQRTTTSLNCHLLTIIAPKITITLYHTKLMLCFNASAVSASTYVHFHLQLVFANPPRFCCLLCASTLHQLELYSAEYI